MIVARIERGFVELPKLFGRLLEADAPDLLAQASSELKYTKTLYETQARQTHDPNQEPTAWGYTIHPNRPLRFVQSEEIKGFDPIVDVYGHVRWIEEGSLPVEQSFVLRVWSEQLAYRPNLDSDSIERALNSKSSKKRVILRYHFDLANIGQDGPKFHLQFGGKPQDEELFWFPKIASDLPRLPSPPMDLILMCQIVAANFFRDEYLQLSRRPEWKALISASEEAFLKPYIDKCATVLEDMSRVSLLDSISNAEWKL